MLAGLGLTENEGVDVSETASISASIAGRYAQALFDICKEEGALDALEKDADALSAALADSADLRAMIASPLYTREQQGAAIVAVANGLGVHPMVANTLALMAGNRRLFVLPALVRMLRARIAAEKGVVTAEVTSAKPLTEAQAARLAETLKARVGKDIKLNTTVDDSLIGGLVVKVGSKMIDSSIRSKLAALQNAMKEVG